MNINIHVYGPQLNLRGKTTWQRKHRWHNKSFHRHWNYQVSIHNIPTHNHYSHTIPWRLQLLSAHETV